MIAAIVPAAGRSERMGRPKLILPIGRTTVIARVVAALRDGGAEPVIVVTPPASFAGAAILADEARNAGASVLVPTEHPIDMRASVELGLDHLGQGSAPDRFLVAPADSPSLTPELVGQVVAQARAAPQSIVIPVYHGRRGHPIALPWQLADKIRALPLGVGLNALIALRAAEVAEIEVADPGAVEDLDTPEDYRRLADLSE
jgi:molybdenum cofactor cytidylyltransferase